MAASTKAEADALFRKAKYGEAATKYGLAIKQDPENEKLYGNRAACCEKLAASLWGPEKVGWLQCGVTDGRKATTLAPAWGKGPRASRRLPLLAAHVVDCAWERDDYDELHSYRGALRDAETAAPGPGLGEGAVPRGPGALGPRRLRGGRGRRGRGLAWTASSRAALPEEEVRETSEDPAVQAELHRLRVDNRARGGAEAVARALNEAPGAGPQMVDIEKLLKNVRPDLADAFPGGLPGMGGMPGGMPPGMGLDNIKTAAEMQSEPQVPDAELRKLARACVARMGDAAPPLPPGEVREVGADGAFEA
ncbi:hypothetical protein JL721_6481 [Aureococcus anophagefferens]|nr:hypothetical protein JL721_6481 [Aureococcus anophagefferens]